MFKNILFLTVIGRDDANLRRCHAHTQQVCDNLFDIRSLRAVQIRCTGRRDLFHAHNRVKEHGFTRDRPREVLLTRIPRRREQLTICLCHTVLQASFVKHIRRKLGQCRMHAVLDLQTNRAISNQHQAFKERPCETRLGCRLVHYNGAQLAMITDKHNLLCPHHDRNQSFSFNRLRSFVQQNLTKAKLFQTRITSTHTSTANHICGLENFTFRLISQGTVLLLIAFLEFTNFVSQALQFLKLVSGSERRHDVQTQMIHI
mmetsp:Transcript_1843/g.3621  ORF Transcript_1843/g.3621 Transcript_1843/m.3621 type:complete len:259 (+) Transcript_1843:213-989(+)